MKRQVMDRKAHHPATCSAVREGFLSRGVELNLNGLDGFGKQRREKGLPEKEDEGSTG